MLDVSEICPKLWNFVKIVVGHHVSHHIHLHIGLNVHLHVSNYVGHHHVVSTLCVWTMLKKLHYWFLMASLTVLKTHGTPSRYIFGTAGNTGALRTPFLAWFSQWKITGENTQRACSVLNLRPRILLNIMNIVNIAQHSHYWSILWILFNIVNIAQ